MEPILVMDSAMTLKTGLDCYLRVIADMMVLEGLSVSEANVANVIKKRHFGLREHLTGLVFLLQFLNTSNYHCCSAPVWPIFMHLFNPIP